MTTAIRTDCALCGCDASEHWPRFLKPARPCQIRNEFGDPCGCPGFEEHDDEQDGNG